MSKPKLCLNMIVKNEAHIISETLECVYKYIDYYVINDTGSTDNTVEVIKTFFDSKNIKGEIIVHEFRSCKCHTGIYKTRSYFHFGWNRTFAFEQCEGKSEYIWIIDADDLVVGEMDFSNLTEDCYMVTIGKGFTYPRGQIFKNDPSYHWKYVGARHEYPTCDKKDTTKALLPGNYYIDSRRLGDRSMDKDKYANDAKVFEEELLYNPNNERDMFYCAQSYYDAKNYVDALRWYKRRIEKGGWFEETYFSYYKVAQCYDEMRRNGSYTWLDVENAYIDAYNFCKTHAEPFFEIAKHYRELGDFANGYTYAKKASRIQYPTHDVLFIFKNVYDYRAKDEMAMCAFGLRRYYEAYNIAKAILDSGLVDDNDVNRINGYMMVAANKLNDKNKKTCCLYFGNEYIVKDYDKFTSILDSLSKGFILTIVGSNIAAHDDILIIPGAHIDAIKKDKFDYLIVWDYINYFYDNINLLADHIILYQSDELIKLRLENNIFASIHNSAYLNQIFCKISTIVCSTQDVKDKFTKTYNLSTDSVKFLNGEYHKLSDIKKQKYVFKLTINNTTNGLEYHEPNYIKNIDENKYVNGKQIVVNIYENIIKKYPFPEHFMRLFEILYAHNNYTGASLKLDKALTLLKNNKGYEDTIKIHKTKLLVKQEKYEEAYEFVNSILQKNTIPDKVREHFEDVRDDTIMFFKDKVLTYPNKKIKGINNPNNSTIIFTVTTCKRFDLFEKTINSFLNCCTDSHLIGHWLCVDDNSSEEDRTKMKRLYPFFKFIWKNESQKGHFISMNIIRDYVIEMKATHILHCEDDWHFFQKRNYITDALKIFGAPEKLGQVLFNKNYAEAEFSLRKTKGGIHNNLTDGTRYVIHEHYETGTKEYDTFVNKYKGYGTCAYWEGFSFRPSLLKVSMFKDIGPFYNTDHFERAYALEYKARAYLSAFFDTYCCIHIGKKTWEQSANSYTLNSTGQFNLDKENLCVNILSTSADMFKSFKEHNKNKLPYFSRCTVRQIGQLNDLERKLLVLNEYQYMRPDISNMMFHVNMIINCKSKNMLFLKDNVMLRGDFNKNFTIFNKYKFDLIIFNPYSEEDKGVYQFNEKINLNNYIGYLVSRSGMDKILNFIGQNGVKNMNYLDNLTDMRVFRYDKLYDYKDDLQTLTLTGCASALTDRTIDTTDQYKTYDGYKFYCLMDSFGFDLNYIGQKSVDDIKKEAEKLGAKAFNTLGWIKFAVTPEEQFINLPNSSFISEGLYVKI